MSGELPIVLLPHEVLGILDGAQTQLRRIPGVDGSASLLEFTDGVARFGAMSDAANSAEAIRCPYGRPGGRLWVQEMMHYKKAPGRKLGTLVYTADGTRVPGANGSSSSEAIRVDLMPRRFARIVLEITDLRVQRLQDIKHADAIAEGCPGRRSLNPELGYTYSPREQFHLLWDRLFGPRMREDNAWTWVIAFRRVTQ